jgi:hypothetical protein
MSIPSTESCEATTAVFPTMDVVPFASGDDDGTSGGRVSDFTLSTFRSFLATLLFSGFGGFDRLLSSFCSFGSGWDSGSNTLLNTFGSPKSFESSFRKSAAPSLKA